MFESSPIENQWENMKTRKHEKQTKTNWKHISRLFAFLRNNSVTIIVYHYTRLWQAWLCNANNPETQKNSRVQPNKKVYHYDCYVLSYTIISRLCLL